MRILVFTLIINLFGHSAFAGDFDSYYMRPESAEATSEVSWAGKITHGSAAFAIDGSRDTAWTTDKGYPQSITFDLGSEMDIKALKGYVGGSTIGNYLVNIYIDEELVLENFYICHSGFEFELPNYKQGQKIRWEVLGSVKLDESGNEIRDEVDISANTWSELRDLEVLVCKMSPLQQAIINKDAIKVELLLTQGHDINGYLDNERSKFYGPPLLIAAFYYFEIIPRLLKYPECKRLAKDSDSFTALHKAAYFGSYEVARLLVINVPELLTEKSRQGYGRETPDTVALMYPGRGSANKHSIAIYLGFMRQLAEQKIPYNVVSIVASYLPEILDPHEDRT